MYYFFIKDLLRRDFQKIYFHKLHLASFRIKVWRNGHCEVIHFFSSFFCSAFSTCKQKLVSFRSQFFALFFCCLVSFFFLLAEFLLDLPNIRHLYVTILIGDLTENETCQKNCSNNSFFFLF